jgi:hypothetical protein
VRNTRLGDAQNVRPWLWSHHGHCQPASTHVLVGGATTLTMAWAPPQPIVTVACDVLGTDGEVRGPARTPARPPRATRDPAGVAWGGPAVAAAGARPQVVRRDETYDVNDLRGHMWSAAGQWRGGGAGCPIPQLSRPVWASSAACGRAVSPTVLALLRPLSVPANRPLCACGGPGRWRCARTSASRSRTSGTRRSASRSTSVRPRPVGGHRAARSRGRLSLS